MHPDREKSGGFFNKVMHLVRGDSRASDAISPDSESLSAREVLQESMVRKRRNEAIRRHEFAQLRLLRQRNEEGGVQQTLLAAKDDSPASLLGQETRSHETLQKIDAIEAQMSSQWWRNPAKTLGKGEKPVVAHHALNARQLESIPVLGEESVVSQQVGAAPIVADASVECISTDPAAQTALAPEAAVCAPPTIPVFQSHPDLEEAAILFAHGDVDGARTRLLEQLVQGLSTQPIDEEKAAILWHAVLDVCRATGDEEAFEPLAIDYAEHFGRSAPLWFSIPHRLGVPSLAGSSQQASNKRQFQWSSPSMLTVGSVTALRVAQAEAPQPWSMSWQRLAAVDEAALAPFTKLLQEWAGSQGQFVLSDAGKLLAVLEERTSTGDRNCNRQWWEAHLALLRLMNRMEAYEDLALNYCITYEVSPPSWVGPMCLCVVQEEGEADVSILQEASVQSRLTAASGVIAVAPATLPQGLYGVLEGDQQALLEVLTAQAKSGQVLDVPCDNLIRLDFVAAGSVLNWAAEMQSQGYRVRFTKLHYLVAVFFHVIGIQEHATLQATPV